MRPFGLPHSMVTKSQEKEDAAQPKCSKWQIAQWLGQFGGMYLETGTIAFLVYSTSKSSYLTQLSHTEYPIGKIKKNCGHL